MNYDQLNDLDRIAQITDKFRPELGTDLEEYFCTLWNYRTKLEKGIPLTTEDRIIIGDIGDFLYNELYSDIGKMIGKFNDIKYQTTEW